MTKRKIIEIDLENCNGCGQCIPGCPEGALQIIDGKARLISDLFCDGLGACIGTCPENAITVIEREAEPYDERKVMENIIPQGDNVIKAHLEHLQEHGETDLFQQAVAVLKEKGMAVPQSRPGPPPTGCPGAAMRDMRQKAGADDAPAAPVQSQLQNWPVQLQLLNPQAPYLKNSNLVVAADCVPFAYPNFHSKFLKGQVLTILCPKLDQTMESYIDKLTTIFSTQDIKSVSVVHMEVPCCTGTLMLVQRALEKAGRVIPLKEYTISVGGEII